MIKHALIFGLIGSLLIISWFFGSYIITESNPYFSFWGNLVIVIVGISVFFSIYFYAKPLESFSFGQGIAIGGLSLLIMSTISASIIYLIVNQYFAEIIELYKSESMVHLVKNKKQLIEDSSQEIYDSYLKSIPKINTYNSTTRYFISNLIVPGLMLSVLSTLPLRKKVEKNENVN